MELAKAGISEEQASKNDDKIDQTKPKFVQKLKRIVSNLTIEPIVVLYVIPVIMAKITMQNLTLDKACRVNLKLNEATCDALASRNATVYTKEDEIVVQKLVASMFAWKVVLQSVMPAIILLFAGSWSDRHGRRKPFILLPILGETLTCAGYLICTYFYDLPMELNGVSEGVPQALTGGMVTWLMASFSYVAGTCSIQNRTNKIGVAHLLIEACATIGIALSGVIFKAISFYGVFSLCLTLLILSITWGVFGLKENARVHSDDFTNVYAPKKVGFLKDFFDMKHVKDTLLVAFKNGPNNRRMRVCSVFLLVVAINGPGFGEMEVLYLYVRHKLHWNEINFSIFMTCKIVLQILGSMFSLAFFSKYLKIPDALLGIMSITARVLGCFYYSFASTSTLFYLGPVVEMFSGLSHIMMRSILTKLVCSEEIGKVNSLYGVLEALIPLVFGAMFSMLYKSTINVLPGAFFMVGGCITIPAIPIFLWLYFQQRQDEREAKQNQALKKELLSNKVLI